MENAIIWLGNVAVPTYINLETLFWKCAKRCYVKETTLLAVEAKKHSLFFFYPGTMFMTPLLTRHTLDHAFLRNLKEPTVMLKIQ
jgi:hypothetical protein